MNGANHIAGGLAFTGVFASFFNINIFENSFYLITTTIASLLPDIDHTKSYIGKFFYPISKQIDKKFGHRTITHSIFFLATITLSVAILETIYSTNKTISTIVFFSILSHLILDMVTVQGIPLFYPFYKNPCVIPANPNSRIRNDNIRAQAVSFFFFTFVLFTCQDLFANGFWTSYNRAFGTIKHVNSESRNNKNILLVDYEYTKNGKTKKGIGQLIKSTEKEIIIFNKKLIKLKNTDQILHTKPIKTKYKPIINEISFFSISKDSLNKILQNKIISGTIQSNKTFYTEQSNIENSGTKKKFNISYNQYITINQDSTNYLINKQIDELNLKLLLEQNKIKKHNNKLINLMINKRELDNKIKIEKDIYKENNLRKKLIRVKKQIENFQESGINTDLLKFQIENLKNNVNHSEKQLFSGIITIYETIKEYNEQKNKSTEKKEIIKHKYYTLQYSEEHEQALYIKYKLKKTTLETQKVKRQNNFRTDNKIKTTSAETSDYKNSGYDRGHLLPSADRLFSKEANSETFIMSNISPQTEEFNRISWLSLEKQVRRWAIKFDSVEVITAGVLTGGLETIGQNKVSVPNYFYKIIRTYNNKNTIAFVMPNKKTKHISNYVVSIDSIENLTGLDFLQGITNEDFIESQVQTGNFKFH